MSSYLLDTTLAFPYKSIEPAFDLEAQTMIEGHRLDISFSNGEAEGREVTAAQLLSAEGYQGFSDLAAAGFRQDTDLGDMANVVPNARAQQHADYSARQPVDGYK